MDTSSKRWILVCLLLFTLFAGFRSGALPETSSAAYSWRLFDSVFTWLLTIRWFVVDARAHRISMYKAVAPLWFLFTPLAATIYFWNTRGRDKWKALGKSVLFVLVLGIVQGIGFAVADGLVARHH